MTACVPSWSASNARKRVLPQAFAHLRGQLSLARAQVTGELVEVLRACLGRAEAGEAHPRRAGPGAIHDLGEQQDQLRVEARVVGAERLGVELGELAKAARLGRLVPKERPPRPELHRLGQLVHAVLDV